MTLLTARAALRLAKPWRSYPVHCQRFYFGVATEMNSHRKFIPL